MNDLASKTTSLREEIREFVGPNAYYYLDKWSEAMAGNGLPNSFNWPAFLWAGVWFPYRKMYRAAVIFYAVGAVDAIISTILYTQVLQREIPPFWTLAYGLITGMVCGVYANTWYYRHTLHLVERARQVHSSENDYLLILKEQGGTSVAAAIGFVLMGIITIAFTAELIFQIGRNF